MPLSAPRDAYACLPFLQLPSNEPLVMGPLTFWRASEFANHVADPGMFGEYLEHISHVRVVDNPNEPSEKVGMETGVLKLDAMTCVSVDKDVPEAMRQSLLVNSIYLLYFGLNARELYRDQTPLHFSPFGVVVPADEARARNRAGWQDVWIPETSRRRPQALGTLDPSILGCLSQSLQAVYLPETLPSGSVTGNERRVVRAVRFFVDRYLGRFHTPFRSSFTFPHQPENILFLSASIEALYGLEEAGTTAALKKTIRSLPGMGFSQSVELIWGWVDGFYNFQQQMVRASPMIDATYRDNRSYEVSYIYLAVKLFIIAISSELYACARKSNGESSAGGKGVEPWLDHREITHIFWPVDELLEQIAEGLPRLQQVSDRDIYAKELKTLMSIYVTVYKNYMDPQGVVPNPAVKFNLPDMVVMKAAADRVFTAASAPEVADALHTEFLECLNAQFPSR